VLKISGAITDATARTVEVALRKLKKAKDVKAVVLRVDSPGGAVTACETIYQEIQDLPQPVIVSFGNVSASGGYYISAGADRIFASPTTITGSIGVYMVKMDFRGLAKQYGIHFDSVKTSDLSGSFDPFYPMNDRMKENLASSTERIYWRFKSLVGAGRKLDMDFVESVAQGRVWTGEQAKQLGLVDELGGLDRAIAYAQRSCTTSGNAQVVTWPPVPTMWERLLQERRGKKSEDDDLSPASLFAQMIVGLFTETSYVSPLYQSGNIMTSLDQVVFRAPSLSGMMLAADESTAVRCLLANNDVPDISHYFPSSFFD
jgi:signal peptide peptidase SppA